MSDAVREFVANAHGDIDAVRATPAADQTFANAAWDWGGDWETALRAAGHIGRRDIAETLLVHGARIDIFVTAMLGDLAVIKAMLDAHPEARDALEPHGIPPRAHAEAGGEAAAAVLAFLDC